MVVTFYTSHFEVICLELAVLSAVAKSFGITVMVIAGQLTKVLTMIRQEICLRVKKPSRSDGEKLTSKLNKLIKDHLSEFST